MTFIVEYPQNLISMKTTQPKKRGRPVGSKNKFKTNEFAKKYKEVLAEPLTHRSVTTVKGLEEDEEDILENANQVKSWKRGGISETLNLTYLFLGVIIGFSVCAIVVTPLVINSI